MSEVIKAVEFVAEIRQVKKLSDHTVNVTLNLPEYCNEQATWFFRNQLEMVKGVMLLQALSNGREQHEEQTNGRTARNPLGVDSG